MKKETLIIGGGITGLSLAWELSCLGISSTIVEKAPFMGGHVSNFACKVTQTCQKCGACQLEDYLSKMSKAENVDLMVSSTVNSLTQNGRDFKTTILQRKSMIVSDKCDDCGLCLKVCPVQGALFYPAFDSRLYISNEKCLNSSGVHCEFCAQICPQGAVELQEKSREVEIEVASIAICTGFSPYDPTQKLKFGYRRVPGVITSLELDSILRTGNFQSAAFGEAPKSVAFIQCVGSRDPRSGTNYCSQICCGVSIRLARLIKNRYPDINLTIFYMDIQTFEREFDRTLDRAQNDINFIRAMPSEIHSDEDGFPRVVYHGGDETREVTPFDLVVLSVGIAPRDPDLPGSFPALWRNRDGFIGSDDNDVDAGHPGIFVAGAAQGPKSISACVSHAILAASQIKRYLDRAKRGE